MTHAARLGLVGFVLAALVFLAGYAFIPHPWDVRRREHPVRNRPPT